MEKISTFWFVQGLIGRLAERGVPRFNAHPLLKHAGEPRYGGYEGTPPISRDSQRRENANMSGYQAPGARDDNEHLVDSDELADAKDISPSKLHRRHMLMEALRAQGMDISEEMENRMLSRLDESVDADGDGDVNEMLDESEGIRSELPLTRDSELAQRGVDTASSPMGHYQEGA